MLWALFIIVVGFFVTLLAGVIALLWLAWNAIPECVSEIHKTVRERRLALRILSGGTHSLAEYLTLFP